ncbi:MAG: glycosyltransferase family A protein [Dehalococcoidia bacterium]
MTAAVSVVIPVYNGERFLGEALDSVARQTVQPDEVIVVDDGSTDSTPTILAAQPGHRVVTTTNRGPAAARNTGVAASSGDLVAFLDADDWWLPQKLEVQLGLFEGAPSAGLALCHLMFHFESSVPGWMSRIDPAIAHPAFIPSAWLMRRQAWELVGPFNESLRTAEDVDWMARARDLGVEFAVADEMLFHRRIHDANLTGEAITQTLLGVLRESLGRKRAAGGAVP